MKTTKLLLTILVALSIINCSEDNNINTSMVKMNMSLSEQLQSKEVKVEKLFITLKNVNTGAESTEEANSLSLSNLVIEDGIYNVTVLGNVSYDFTHDIVVKKEDGTKETQTITDILKNQVKGYKENIEVKGGNINLNIPLVLFNENASTGFVISEIKLEATKTPNNKGYYLDTFIEIYNNSNETLYADGLCIGEGALRTDKARSQYTPDIRENAFPLGVVLRVPGNGSEHPVAPGQTFVIADTPINHLTNNANSYDLSKANFEWHFAGSKKETDVAEIPNIEIIGFYGSKTAKWKVGQATGTKGYVLFKLDNEEAKQFTKNNSYEFEFYDDFYGEIRKYKNPAWKIENDKIIDAVETTRPAKHQWKTMSQSIDLAWTHCGDGVERYQTSIKRRISSKDGERIVLQDTNDSASDFIPMAKNPSPGSVEDHK